MKQSSIKRRRLIADTVKILVGVGIVLFVMTPILVTIFASFKDRAGMTTSSPLSLPNSGNFTWENYQTVFANNKLYIGLKNTAIIVAVSLIFNVLFGSLTAYCLERFKFRGRGVIFALFFLGMMIPTFVTEISRFKIIEGMGVYNTLGAPIIIYIASDLLQLYIYRQFISTIPVSIDESALMDGCSYFRLFWQIVFPLMAPATATVVIIKAVNIINDMFIPYLYMPSNKLKTLTTFLMNYSNAQQGSWQLLSAAVIIVLVPTVLIYVFFSKKIMSGLAAGAVKE